MRCPRYLFHRLFRLWGRTQGPHDPLLPGGPMSCQSVPGYDTCFFGCRSGHRGPMIPYCPMSCQSTPG
ncbi:unnamed protein product, partial [Staurois parvus]